LKRGDPCARAVGARVGIGVVVYLHLAAARVAWAQQAQDSKLPVPWPTSPSEVIPEGATVVPKAPPKVPATVAPSTVPPASSAASSSITQQPPATPPTASAPPATAAPASTTAPPPAPNSAAAAGATTHIGAIGDGVVFIDKNQDAEWDLRRLMVTLTHKPTGWLRFHAEAGLEHGDTFAAQQVIVELTPTPAFRVRAGLLLLPLGLINQHNAPPEFLTVDRPLTDQLIIPTIWRDLGAGIFGEVGEALRYEIDVVRGLDGTGFAAQAPLAGGRHSGFGGGAAGAAVVGRLELYSGDGFALGGGGYYGSGTGGEPLLDGVTVAIVEGDARFRGGGFDLRAEYAQFFISDSYRVNDTLGLLGQDAVPRTGRGAYVQVGYDVLRLGDAATTQDLTVFAGFENVNPRSAMSPYNFNPPTITPPGETPPNAPSPARSFVRGGIFYRPLPELAFKVDVQIALDGEGPPPATPVPAMGAPGTPRPLESNLAAAAQGKTRLGLGVGFAF
jgi:hypothetical protein